MTAIVINIIVTAVITVANNNTLVLAAAAAADDDDCYGYYFYVIYTLTRRLQMGVSCILLNLFIYPGVRFNCVMQFGSVFVALFSETKTERV